MKDWNSDKNRIIVEGDNFNIIDSNHKKIIDGTASMWCNVWGYGKNPVIDAMINQLTKLPNSTLFGLGNEPSVILATKLIKMTKPMSKVFFSDNGSTAIEIALKMSIQYWKHKGKTKKKKFLSLNNGYHGDTIATMSVGYVSRYFDTFKSVLLKTFHAPSPKDFESKFLDDSQIMEKCIDSTEKILKNKSTEIAAMIMESGAQIAGGVSIYPKDYQKRISELCKKYDVLLILDEIATGFGRLGNMIEFKAQKSIPDIVCYGKALNGGYFPIAVTLTTDEIYNQFLADYTENKQFNHGHTYTGHPVGCAACISNIDLYFKTNLIEKIRSDEKYISKKLEHVKDLQIVSKIRHKGLLIGIDIKDNNNNPLRMIDGMSINKFIMKESLKHGIYLRTLDNILTIIPPLAIPRKELKIILDTSLDILDLISKK